MADDALNGAGADFAADSEEEDDDASHPDVNVDGWSYNDSHLQRFANEIQRSNPGKRAKLRVAQANRRIARVLEDVKPWSSADKVKLGVALLEVLLETATIDLGGRGGDEDDDGDVVEKAFTYEKMWVKKSKGVVGHICMNEKFQRLALEDEFKSVEGNTSRHQPMVVPPREWTGPNDGGYCALRTDLMRMQGCKAQEVSEAHCLVVLDTRTFLTFLFTHH